MSLNDRFKTFLASLPFVESVDDLNLPSEFDESKRADYLVDNRKMIIELKSLEVDPEHKVHTELEKHKERDEYPLFYGRMEVTKVLKHLPDGEEIQRRLFDKISRSIEGSFRKADEQIGATKTILGCPDSIGLLVLLNENISILSPELISNRVSQLLARKETDGNLHYQNVMAVWSILEGYSLRTKHGNKRIPSIVIDGPSIADRPEFDNIMANLQRNWAWFNGMPLVAKRMKRIEDSAFVRVSELEKEHQGIMENHELWRKAYRKKPYLNSLSDEAVLEHGAKLMTLMAPHFLKDGRKLPSEQMAQFMEGWTHFLEEANMRGLDLKKLPKLEIP